MLLVIDPSLTHLGAILVEEGSKAPTAHAFVSTDPVKDERAFSSDAVRLLEIVTTLDGHFRERRREIERVILEVPAFSRSMQTARKLDKLSAGLQIWAWCRTGKVAQLVQPHEAKRALTGDRDADKKQMIRAAEEKGLWMPPRLAYPQSDRSRKDREAVADCWGILFAAGFPIVEEAPCAST